MDGTNRQDLIKTKLGWPAGITLDIVSKRLYWVDSRFDYIETVTYDGLQRQVKYYSLVATDTMIMSSSRKDLSNKTRYTKDENYSIMNVIYLCLYGVMLLLDIL